MAYGDTKLEKLCTDETEMRTRRPDVASKLKRRIKALEASNSVGDLQRDDPLGRWHAPKSDRAGLWAAKLTKNYRLIIRPETDGEATQAVAVTVVEVTDYH